MLSPAGDPLQYKPGYGFEGQPAPSENYFKGNYQNLSI
jgi:hypothetical protein